MIINTRNIEQLARQVEEVLPKGIRDLGHNLEKKIYQVLQNQLSRINLVSREEFDVQTQVLLRTRAKLTQLELRLHALEIISKSHAVVNDTDQWQERNHAIVSSMSDTSRVSSADYAESDASVTDETSAKHCKNT